VKNGALLAQPFVDISSRVSQPTPTDDERGALGLAFHPQYATNGFFFVYYTNLAGDVVIERLQAAANADVANVTGTIVLTIPHQTSAEHNGGGLAFGPDGFLYVGVGDGGCCFDPSGNGQNTNVLLGKLLRIDVTTLPYTIPAGNPFIGVANRRAEIWAYGLRNPWRFDFDAVAGTLYVADVGEDTYEEVDAVGVAQAGLNYGWKLMEGPVCVLAGCATAGLTLPVLSYQHGAPCSITGGHVYRGTAIPELTGHYFYSDFCAGFLRSFLLAGGVATQQRDWGIAFPGRVTSFGKDSSGELYVLTETGGVLKIVKQ
jgi:glucose/arabinose dehydrogenase